MFRFLNYLNPYFWFQRIVSIGVMQVQVLNALPALVAHHEDNIMERAEHLKLENVSDIDKLTLNSTEIEIRESGDNFKLRGIEVIPANIPKEALSARPLVIHCFGNAGFTSLYKEDMINISRALHSRCVGFNHRNSINSEGVLLSAQDLVNDLKSIVRSYIRSGYPANMIVLKGHSNGGGISAVATKQLRDEGIYIGIYNDRSYSRLSDAVRWIIARSPFYILALTMTIIGFIGLGAAAAYYAGYGLLFSAEAYLKAAALTSIFTLFLASFSPNKASPFIFSALLSPLIRFISYLSGWEVNAAEAFLAIPENKRDYCVVKSPRTKKFNDEGEEIRFEPFDKTINPYASMHDALHDKRSLKRRTLKAALSKTSDPFEAEAIRQQLDSLKNNKLTCDHDLRMHWNGHVTPFFKLRCRQSNYSAHEHFIQFVERTTQTTRTELNSIPTFPVSSP